MAPSWTPARRPSSSKDAIWTNRCLRMRWPGGSNPPKKRGPDSSLFVRSGQGKSRAQESAVCDGGGRGEGDAALLEVPVRRGRFLRGRRGSRSERPLQQDPSEASVPIGGGCVVCQGQRTREGNAGGVGVARDGADAGGVSWQGDGVVSTEGRSDGEGVCR